METTKKKKYESITGKLVSLPQHKQSEGKQAFCVFRIQTPKDYVWLVKCFGMEADKAKHELTDLHLQVSCQGYQEEGSVFVASFVCCQAVESKGARTARYFGSKKQLNEDNAKYAKRMTEEGRVKTVRGDDKVTIWEKKGRCLQFANGVWQQKIEFLMDIYGSAAITKELRNLGLKFNDMGPDGARRYITWLDKKTEEAAAEVGWADE